MKFFIKRKVLSDLNGAVESLDPGTVYNKKFLLTANFVKQQLKPNIDASAAASVESARFLEFQQKRMQTAFSFCKKNADGKPALVNKNQFDFDQENLQKYVDALAPLVKEYEADILADQAAKRQLEELMEETVEIDLPQFSWTDLPEGLTKAQTDSFFVLVKESPEEIQKQLTV